jgi:hypothetical protein
MSPFTKWLPSQQECGSDLIVQLAGGSIRGLEKARKAFERGITRLGLEIGAQSRGEDLMNIPSVRLRISNAPIPSMGHGCDVLAYLGPRLPEGNPFGLQDRSVLLSESCRDEDSMSVGFPDGVIRYHVPFSELNRACGSLRGKGLIAVGLLTKLLEIPKEIMRPWVRPHSGDSYFDAGFHFASEHLHKKDVYGIPFPDTRSTRLLLNVDQSLLLGLGLENCRCDEACVERFLQEPGEDWMMSHARAAWQVVSPVRHPDDPSTASRLQGPHRHVTGVIGIPDPTILAAKTSNAQGVILVPADVLDVFRLTSLARFLRKDTIQIAIDAGLFNCSQTVPSERFAECIREAFHANRNVLLQEGLLTQGLLAQREGEMPADVGFVAWGSTQGAVREAIGLCRKFGMNVAALYPKVLWPFPADDLEAFAATVKQLVVVEPNRMGNLTRLIQGATPLHPLQIFPEVGRQLNLMDIFLKEGFPDIQHESKKNNMIRKENRSQWNP